MDALAAKAAMLPNVELTKPEHTLNFTAVGHIQAGVVGGYVGATEYLIRHARAELGEEGVQVVATGGLAHLMARMMRLARSAGALTSALLSSPSASLPRPRASWAKGPFQRKTLPFRLGRGAFFSTP